MSLVIFLPTGRKDHIAVKHSDGTIITVCGKQVPEGSKLIESAPRVDLCKKCAEWLGREMTTVYLGTDFFGSYKVSLIKHSVRTPTNSKGLRMEKNE